MHQENHLNMEMVIQKLTTLLDVKYIYKSDVTFNEDSKPLLLILLKDHCGTLSNDLSSMVAKIFEDATAYHYRIFGYDYAKQQLHENNLFFVYGCQWEHCIYKDATAEVDVFFEYHIQPKTLNIVKARFDTEHLKMAAFMDGAGFFVEQGHLAQAVFMLHQCMELWYRYAALFIMGKERKSHRIKDLQTYIMGFAPQLGRLFNTEIEEEQLLLQLLDASYIGARYSDNYSVNLTYLNALQDKAQELERLVTLLFQQQLEACTHRVQQTQEVSKERDIEASVLSKFMGSLSEKDFPTLKPCPFREGIYSVGVFTKSYQELSYMISDILKVCVLALETDAYKHHTIPDPKSNIRQTLGYVLDLIPYEELELLDALRYAALESSTKVKSHEH